MGERVPRGRAVVALTGFVTGGLLVAGCATAVSGTAVSSGPPGGNRALVQGYFEALNAAGQQGPSAQRDFLRRTQHPDFTDRLCELGEFTLFEQPAMSTLRADPKWSPEGSSRKPRGTVYVVAVSLSVRREGTSLAEQIGSQRIVVLDGAAYGFTPCPN